MPGESQATAKGRKVTWSELATHKTEGDNWIAINGAVYDVTAFAKCAPRAAPRGAVA